MAVDVLLGLQWGDEGKGKIVDVLAPRYQVVSRFQGGPNAGHTLEFDGIKHVLHQIPSGVFRDAITNVIGNGVVLNPIIFQEEIEGLRKLKVDVTANLLISNRAQLILPTHCLLDACYEKAKGVNKIGSTLKGIGPTYQDKIGRLGLRVGDALEADFRTRYREIVAGHAKILDYYQFDYDLADSEEEFFNSLSFMKQFKIVDTAYYINQALSADQNVLAEGAQGSLLDVDFGSYPFVTSSNTMVAGVCSGLGVAPSKVGEVYGIFKAYCTRVGSGPFPTELFDEVGEKLRTVGHEFGATTGRPRRCGWLDLPALKYTIMINGVTQLFMMKADVLNDFEEIQICTHYKMPDGSVVDELPFELNNKDITPIYRSQPGWKQSLEGFSSFEQLPEALLDYVSYLEEQLQVPINVVSIGPDRKQTILRSQVIA